ncbi:MAG TPA: hypothetical protein VMN03_05680 [Burkholderiales bacterium]|nr:hypothetical protein [Burkholderiales bacterium]
MPYTDARPGSVRMVAASLTAGLCLGLLAAGLAFQPAAAADAAAQAAYRPQRADFGRERASNIPAKFYENVVRPAFTGTKGIVYVLPETRSAREVFNSYDVE